MGDITSGITGGLSDILSNIGNFASNIGGDISSGISDVFGGAPAVDPSLSPTSIAPTAGTGAASFGEFGADSVTPATVAGTFGDISGLSDVVSQLPPVSDPSLSFTAGVTPGQGQAFIGMEQPSTGAAPAVAAPSGAGATLPMDTVPPQPPATALTATSTPPTPVTAPTGGGAAGGGGMTALAATPQNLATSPESFGSDIVGGGGSPTVTTSNPSEGGGVLDWLSKQLTGPGSLKSDLQMLAALGGLGMNAFKPNAIPGAGQTLSPSGTSTGQAVSTAQQQQQLAQQEQATAAQQQRLAAEAEATQPQQEQIAQQQQNISAQQTAQAPPLLATGQQQVAAAASGQLTPAQQAYVTQALQANQQQIRAKYANLGLSGSTMEQSDLNQANLQAQAMIAGLLNQNQTQGLNTVAAGQSALTGGGTSLESASRDITAGVSGLTAGSSDINQAVSAFNQSVAALGSSGKTYLDILQQQLAQDQDLQKALAQMASSLGTSTALSQFGNAASAGGNTSG